MSNRQSRNLNGRESVHVITSKASKSDPSKSATVCNSRPIQLNVILLGVTKE